MHWCDWCDCVFGYKSLGSIIIAQALACEHASSCILASRSPLIRSSFLVHQASLVHCVLMHGYARLATATLIPIVHHTSVHSHRILRRSSSMMATRSESAAHLSALPVDARASIFAFLRLSDFAHFSAASRACHKVASLDLLWSPMLVRHFSDVQVPLRFSGLSPSIKLRALAPSLCSVCTEVLLSAKLSAEIIATCHVYTTRYLAPHSCGYSGCGLICCAACRCRCHCLRIECEDAKTSDVSRCDRCQGWAYHPCEELIRCEDDRGCEAALCDECQSANLRLCELCCGSFCRRGSSSSLPRPRRATPC
jgi:hypothetical protein